MNKKIYHLKLLGRFSSHVLLFYFFILNNDIYQFVYACVRMTNYYLNNIGLDIGDHFQVTNKLFQTILK